METILLYKIILADNSTYTCVIIPFRSGGGYGGDNRHLDIYKPEQRERNKTKYNYNDNIFMLCFHTFMQYKWIWLILFCI